MMPQIKELTNVIGDIREDFSSLSRASGVRGGLLLSGWRQAAIVPAKPDPVTGEAFTGWVTRRSVLSGA